MLAFLPAVASILVILNLCAADGGRLNSSASLESVGAAGRVAARSAHGFTYNRWDRDDETPNDNEVNKDDQRGGFEMSSAGLPARQEFVCGRTASASRTIQAAGERGGPRSKYRPLEIRMPRVIGGDETAPGEFPWAVSVKLNGQPICGGSLIANSWILTAAHCVVGYNPKNLTVRLGAYRIKDLAETHSFDLPVSLFIVHKDYSIPRPFSNDIALLKMSEPVEYSDYIIPICLPTDDQTPPQMQAPPSSVGVSYSSRLDRNRDELAGIVISTKMSDAEIANCFNRLEQNYLTSIGLGSGVESGQAASEPETSSSASSMRASTTPASPPPSMQQQQHPSSSPYSLQTLLSAYGNPLDSNYWSSQSRPEQLTPEQLSKFAYLQQQQQQQQPPKTMQLQDGHFIRPSLYQLREPSYAQTFTIDLESLSNGFESSAGLASGQPAYSVYHQSLPYWSSALGRRASQGHLDGAPSGGAKPLEARNEELGRVARSERIKFSRLPINKELLHEIQSVGSGPMPMLNLGLHQGDFMTMANDLSKQQGAPQVAAHKEATGQLGGVSGASEQGANIGQQLPATSNVNSNGNDNGNNDHRAHYPDYSMADDRSRNVIRATYDHEDSDQTANNEIGKYAGLSGIVVGWGWVREYDGDDQSATNKGYPSVVLQKVRLPILKNKVCEAWFQSQSKKITLLPSQFCAGFNSGGKDACRGDSGGPMIIEDESEENRYKLIGIVSAGIGCARPSLPGLYTRVASFLPWIDTQMNRY